MTDCPTCTRLREDSRDARVRLLHAMDDDEAHRRAYEDHEATHGWKPMRRWEDAPPVAVTWQSPEGVSYTFAPGPEDAV